MTQQETEKPVPSQPTARVSCIDLSIPDPLQNDANRSTLATFTGLTTEELPDFSTDLGTVELGGHKARIIANKQSTTGKFCCIEMQHPQNFGPPLHLHKNEDEFFLILEGSYLYQVGKGVFKLEPGDLLFTPKGIPHTFFCEKKGKTLVFTNPAGFEEFVLESSKKGANITELAPKYGISFIGPAINPNATFWKT